MCNKLNEVLSTMKETDEPMTKKEMIPTLKAIGEDMEKQSNKISKLEKKVDNLQETQNLILQMVQKINNKLDDEKIEEKAYAYDQNQKIVHNWKVVAVITLIIMLAGAGVLKLIDKADNIATIVKATK